MSTKGQIFSTDFLVATSIFLVIVTALYTYWTYSSIQLEETRRLNDLIDISYLTSNVWMRTGTPVYWNSSNVVDIGLQNDHRFNQSKLDALNDIGYKNVSSMIGVLPYNFYLRIYDMSNNTIFDFGNLSPDSDNVVKVKRIGIMNGSIVYIDTVVWE